MMETAGIRNRLEKSRFGCQPFVTEIRSDYQFCYGSAKAEL